MCYILCTNSSNICYVARGMQRGLRGVVTPCVGVWGKGPQEKKILGKRVAFFLIFHVALIFVSILGNFFGTWFFFYGFLFSVKELGFFTNPCHWVCSKILYKVKIYKGERERRGGGGERRERNKWMESERGRELKWKDIERNLNIDYE
jgi:hypothetical protein